MVLRSHPTGEQTPTVRAPTKEDQRRRAPRAAKKLLERASMRLHRRSSYLPVC